MVTYCLYLKDILYAPHPLDKINKIAIPKIYELYRMIHISWIELRKISLQLRIEYIKKESEKSPILYKIHLCIMKSYHEYGSYLTSIGNEWLIYRGYRLYMVNISCVRLIYINYGSYLTSIELSFKFCQYKIHISWLWLISNGYGWYQLGNIGIVKINDTNLVGVAPIF